MTLTLARAAVRRHPLSMLFTALLVALSARLLGMPVPVALAGWATLSLFGITVSHTLEPIILRCLEKSPSKRYQRVENVLEDLGAVSTRLDATAA